MTKDEALKLALEALQVETTPLTKDRQEVLRAITAIKEALAQPTSGDYALGYSIGFGEGHSAGKALAQSKEPEQEPVAWEQFYPDIGKLQLTHPPQGIYYTPPQRKPLTDEQINQIADEFIVNYRIPAGSHYDFAKAIEAAHNIKE